MVKLKFSGYINNGLKKERKDHSYINGTTSFFFFINLFPIIFGSTEIINIKFIKKNKYNLCFVKSNIRYKVSKHLVNRVCNKYIVTIALGDITFNRDFLFAFKFVSAFSSVYLNSNYTRIKKTSTMTSFFKL